MTAGIAALPDTEMQAAVPGTDLGVLVMQQQQQQQLADARVREEKVKGERRSYRWCAAGLCIGLLLATVAALAVYLVLRDEPAVRELVVRTPDTPVRLRFDEETGRLVGDVPVQVGWDGARKAGCVELAYSVGDGADEVRVQVHDGKVPVTILAAHAGNLTVHVRATCNGTGEVAAETPTSYYAFRPDLLVADETCGEVDCGELEAGRLVCDAKLRNASRYQHVLSEKCGVVGSVLSVSAVGDGRWAFAVKATGLQTAEDLRQVFAAGRFVIDTHVAEAEADADEAGGNGDDEIEDAAAGRGADAQLLSRTFKRKFSAKVETPQTWLSRGSKAAVGAHGKVEVRAVLTLVFPCTSWFNLACYKAVGVRMSLETPLDAHAYMNLALAEGTLANTGGQLARIRVFKAGLSAVHVELHGHARGEVLRAGEVGLAVHLGGRLEVAYDSTTNDFYTHNSAKVTYDVPSADDLPTLHGSFGLKPKLMLDFGLLQWKFVVGVGFPIELDGTAHLSKDRCMLEWGITCEPELGWGGQPPALAGSPLTLLRGEIDGRCSA